MIANDELLEVAIECAHMAEDVIPAIVRREETEAPIRIPHFDFAVHLFNPFV
jgi:hypothetical protein